MSVGRDDLIAHATDLAYDDLMVRRALVLRRRMRGLTQQDVADRLGSSVEEVVAMESHDGDPRQSDIRRYRLFLWAEENGGWDRDGEL